MTSYTGHIAGNLYLRPGDDAIGVTGVGGSVVAYPDANFELPACESVGGSVVADAGARIELPACKSVGGVVEADEGARVELPSCPRDAIAGAVWRGKGARVDLLWPQAG